MKIQRWRWRQGEESHPAIVLEHLTRGQELRVVILVLHRIRIAAATALLQQGQQRQEDGLGDQRMAAARISRQKENMEQQPQLMLPQLTRGLGVLRILPVAVVRRKPQRFLIQSIEIVRLCQLICLIRVILVL
jgi:hypothetical protein